MILPEEERFQLIRSLPFLSIPLGCLLVFWTGVSPVALALCAAMYVIRLCAIGVGYHTYFAHRAFKTGRVFQFLLAVVGASAAQNGPLWWAGGHRYHHRRADAEDDLHSPRKSLWWAYAGWLLCKKNSRTMEEEVQDFLQFPELRWLNRYHVLSPAALIIILFLLGTWLHHAHPSLRTSGLQMVVWGFCVSTTLMYHATFLVNALSHRIGWRRFHTGDGSRNIGWLAVVTMGEWHNNHHAFPASARRGFTPWEIDVSYYVIKALSWIGLVWDVREPPAEALTTPGVRL